MDFRFFDAEWLVGGDRRGRVRRVEARLVRAPYPDVEVQTTRAYVLARRTGEHVAT